ncbi:CehA/McbA family metallohydrolase [Stieleria sp. ICT_E10.1]|uniref:CehA/McbA family metallohydrolase n=1 Tax=Stieleria sedimenti TaxID=2976331 RepID=UPI00217FF99B|nr:CehA/McbA family metallohydrolase [Stieleria sedimenti]MCS7471357.1 CehA/McbA family metallohydrolase [Stieleria sedimenti]
MNIARYVSSRNLLAIGIAICLMHPGRLADGQDDLAIVHRVPKQPLLAATARLAEAMEFAGSPLDEATRAAILLARELDTPADVSRAIQSTLDPLCLASVHINAESRVKVAEGPVKKQLMQQGWRAFLVKVHNEAGITAELVADSPNAAPVYQQGRGARQQPRTDEDLVDPSETEDRWLDLSMLNRAPMKKQLSGLNLEYRIVMLGSRDAGKREANIAFNVGQGTQDIGFRNSVPILFDCQRAVDVQLGISDVDGKPTTASLLITDDRGRVYPNPAKRLAPDFFFHHQVYRADGESVLLPPGEYNVSVTRGPEYVPIRRRLQIPETAQHRESFQLKRWIHLAKRRWYSGDHHVHAAGCAHYDSPTEGVGPEDMMRHLLGEDVNVGCVLSWGPCWYTQKEFFNGQTSALSTEDNLMRYDVEVSGFPSSHAGHLCLLNLSEDDYPGTKVLEDWPSWTLPVLKWGKQQGGVVGYSHSGWGLALPDKMPDGSRKFVGRPWGGAAGDWRGRAADTLPDYEMPPFDGIGANEYIVTVTEDVCDFISAVDTPAIWELNIWYHTLNCGMTARISGETDFPCIYGDRVGLGRIYVQLDEDHPLNYENWIAGLKDGRSYCGDGLSHIIDFAVDGLGVGQKRSATDSPSRLDLAQPETVNVTFDVAALLKESPTDETERIRKLRLDEKPYWHLERCRIGDSRRVPVEVIVNGRVAATREIVADGSLTSHSIPVPIDASSWIALRILPSVHTNPVFVHVAGEPIRASKKSAQWCIDAVETCWNSKRGQIRESERAEAKAAYDRAAERYRTILTESKQ